MSADTNAEFGSAFERIKAGIEEMIAVERGEAKPARVTRIVVPDVAAIREKMGLTQEEFAIILGISPRTLQDWEQGRRQPRGPARSLLLVAMHDPQAVIDGVRAGRTVTRYDEEPAAWTAVAEAEQG